MTDGPEKLQGVVDSLLRQQPLRRAPATLEARVLTQIALQQELRPWWRQGFSHWPLAARVVFLLASYGFIRLALAGAMSVLAFVRSGEVAGTAVSWTKTGAGALSATGSAFASLVHAVPPLWLYGTAAFAFVLYALLFGLGTVAYRTLYVQR
jgi:hypothetical protein